MGCGDCVAGARRDCGHTILPLVSVPLSTLSPVQTPSSPAGVRRLVCRVRDLTIVIPCFNEEAGIAPLVERLIELRTSLTQLPTFRVILVDDGSTDETWPLMLEAAARYPWLELLRHSHNRGITAAVMTGIQAAGTQWVATMDSDCTYDPMQLHALIDAVDDDVAMVTASPYHAHGKVVGVPKWRLWLSRAASRAYAVVLGQSIHTYTSCFRLYRRSAVASLTCQDNGFVGITELLWLVIRGGGKVVETPAVLTSRRLGYSKLRTLPVMFGHLRLISRIAVSRIAISLTRQP